MTEDNYVLVEVKQILRETYCFHLLTWMWRWLVSPTRR